MTKKPRPGSSSRKRPKRTSIPAHFAARPRSEATQPGGEVDARPTAFTRPNPAASAVSRPALGRLTSSRPSTIHANYDYVLSDVKQIGIASGVMLAIILSLTFVMR